MSRETVPKSKTYPNRDASGRAILPSKTRHGGLSREPVRERHSHKLEANAQHIAELLEEMHSERYKMQRQRSDISGQAQKAAAQRSASRRRRRSLGDENNELQNEIAEKKTQDKKAK
jgi:K+/H+ antiporter YhaU regulatory subunit KhtT